MRYRNGGELNISSSCKNTCLPLGDAIRSQRPRLTSREEVVRAGGASGLKVSLVSLDSSLIELGGFKRQNLVALEILRI